MNETAKSDSVVSKLTDRVSISIAEYERLLRDKTQLDMILSMRLNTAKNYAVDYVIDSILEQRGMKA